MNSLEEIEDFFGVYCLCSKSDNPRYKNRVYIGFTVDPNRRIKQHNRGIDFGGAKKTSNRGPWSMIFLVYGFPNKICALRFEWAWQKPSQSRILRSFSDLQRRRPREPPFDYHFRILAEMLRTAPWNRLPLTVQWLNAEFFRDFPADKIPPLHIPIRKCGRIKIRKKVSAVDEDVRLTQSQGLTRSCLLCDKTIGQPLEEMVTCIYQNCRLVAHIVCLAKSCLVANPGQLIPVQGKCALCDREYLWGDVIRKQKGCSDVVEDLNNTDAFEVNEISDDDVSD